MNLTNLHNFKRILKKFLILVIGLQLLLPTEYIFAQGILESTEDGFVSQLPAPGTMVGVSDSFAPSIIKGLKIYPSQPFQLDFIVDTGESSLADEDFKQESIKLIKYFLASLTVPEDDLWVNLSPYEKDRIIPNSFGITEMGRDLLAQDYLLKQLTATLMYPEDDLGEEFWSRIYSKAYAAYGTTDIPIDTFNKVWIIPESAAIYEDGDRVFIEKARLKVLLEEDYFASKQQTTKPVKPAVEPSPLATEIIREVIIPEIETEVNEGAAFAPLRQIYYSVILATWFKRNLKEGVLGQSYVDQNKVTGVDVNDPDIKMKIYQRYLEAYKVGLYNYIREDYDPHTQTIIPRKYFSGGSHMRIDYSMLTRSTKADLKKSARGLLKIVSAWLRGGPDELSPKFSFPLQKRIRKHFSPIDRKISRNLKSNSKGTRLSAGGSEFIEYAIYQGYDQWLSEHYATYKQDPDIDEQREMFFEILGETLQHELFMKFNETRSYDDQDRGKNIVHSFQKMADELLDDLMTSSVYTDLLNGFFLEADDPQKEIILFKQWFKDFTTLKVTRSERAWIHRYYGESIKNSHIKKLLKRNQDNEDEEIRFLKKLKREYNYLSWNEITLTEDIIEIKENLNPFFPHLNKNLNAQKRSAKRPLKAGRIWGRSYATVGLATLILTSFLVTAPNLGLSSEIDMGDSDNDYSIDDTLNLPPPEPMDFSEYSSEIPENLKKLRNESNAGLAEATLQLIKDVQEYKLRDHPYLLEMLKTLDISHFISDLNADSFERNIEVINLLHKLAPYHDQAREAVTNPPEGLVTKITYNVRHSQVKTQPTKALFQLAGYSEKALNAVIDLANEGIPEIYEALPEFITTMRYFGGPGVYETLMNGLNLDTYVNTLIEKVIIKPEDLHLIEDFARENMLSSVDGLERLLREKFYLYSINVLDRIAKKNTPLAKYAQKTLRELDQPTVSNIVQSGQSEISKLIVEGKLTILSAWGNPYALAKLFEMALKESTLENAGFPPEQYNRITQSFANIIALESPELNQQRRIDPHLEWILTVFETLKQAEEGYLSKNFLPDLPQTKEELLTWVGSVLDNIMRIDNPYFSSDSLLPIIYPNLLFAEMLEDYDGAANNLLQVGKNNIQTIQSYFRADQWELALNSSIAHEIGHTILSKKFGLHYLKFTDLGAINEGFADAVKNAYLEKNHGYKFMVGNFAQRAYVSDNTAMHNINVLIINVDQGGDQTGFIAKTPQEGINWLNKDITILKMLSRNDLVALDKRLVRHIENSFQKKWTDLSDNDLHTLNESPDGEKLKHEISTHLFPKETPETFLEQHASYLYSNKYKHLENTGWVEEEHHDAFRAQWKDFLRALKEKKIPIHHGLILQVMTKIIEEKKEEFNSGKLSLSNLIAALYVNYSDIIMEDRDFNQDGAIDDEFLDERPQEKGIIAKHQVEDALKDANVTFDWDDVSTKLIENDWATRISDTEVKLIINPDEIPIDKIKNFDRDYPGILPVLQQSLNPKIRHTPGDIRLIPTEQLTLLVGLVFPVTRLPSSRVRPGVRKSLVEYLLKIAEHALKDLKNTRHKGIYLFILREFMKSHPQETDMVLARLENFYTEETAKMPPESMERSDSEDSLGMIQTLRKSKPSEIPDWSLEDNELAVDNNNLGGIDLNPGALQIESRGNGSKLNPPTQFTACSYDEDNNCWSNEIQPNANIPINGLIPVIINITPPITNFRLLLDN